MAINTKCVKSIYVRSNIFIIVYNIASRKFLQIYITLQAQFITKYLACIVSFYAPYLVNFIFNGPYFVMINDIFNV